MNCINAVGSWFLGSLGLALLVISILLVPQSRALGDPTAVKVCLNGSCDLPDCVTAYPTCPKTCLQGALQKYCKCSSDPMNCPDCTCVLNPADGVSCSCLRP